MRNTLFLSGIILLILSSCAGGPVEDNTQAGNAGEIVESPTPIWRPETVEFQYTDGTVDKTISYIYDDKGRLVNSNELDNRGELLYKREIVYQQGHPVSELISNAGGPVYTIRFNLDDDFNVVEQLKLDTGGDVLSGVSFTYDDGMLVKTSTFDSDGILLLESIYSYENVIVTSVEYMLPDGTVEAKFERIMENGLISMEKTTLSDGTVETARKFEYKENLLVGETQYAGDQLMKSASFINDEYGNISREIWSDMKGIEYEIVERTWIKFESAE